MLKGVLYIDHVTGTTVSEKSPFFTLFREDKAITERNILYPTAKNTEYIEHFVEHLYDGFPVSFVSEQSEHWGPNIIRLIPVFTGEGDDLNISIDIEYSFIDSDKADDSQNVRTKIKKLTHKFDLNREEYPTYEAIAKGMELIVRGALSCVEVTTHMPFIVAKYYSLEYQTLYGRLYPREAY